MQPVGRHSGFDEFSHRRNGLPGKWWPARLSAAFPGRRDAVARAFRDQSSLEVCDRAEDMEYQLAGGRCRVDPFVKTDQVNAAALEILDGFEQFLGPAKVVEARDAQAVAGPGMIDQFGQARTPGTVARDHVREHANGASLHQPVMLACGVLVDGRDTGITVDVAFPGRGVRLFNVRFRDGFTLGHFVAVPGLQSVSLFVSIL